MVLLRLTSDNYDSVVVTPEAYELIALSMSTADYCTHQAEVLTIPANNEIAEQAMELSFEIIDEFGGEA